MNVSTGEFRALTDQVAALAEQVRGVVQREFAVEMVYEAGYAAGETAARGALLGRAAKTSRTSRPRPSHLRPVPGGLR